MKVNSIFNKGVKYIIAFVIFANSGFAQDVQIYLECKMKMSFRSEQAESEYKILVQTNEKGQKTVHGELRTNGLFPTIHEYVGDKFFTDRSVIKQLEIPAKQIGLTSLDAIVKVHYFLLQSLRYPVLTAEMVEFYGENNSFLGRAYYFRGKSYRCE